MSVIDIDQIKLSTSGDESIMFDLITMGLERIESSESEIRDALVSEDWDSLARIIHKLRPVLHFVGLVSLEDKLVSIEKNAKERTNLDNINGMLAGIFTVFTSAVSELTEIRNNLKK